MSLKSLQRQWDAWGREDPLWAALTSADKLGRRWDLDEFMATGRDEVDLVLAHLRDLGAAVDPGRALDFGCGIGRYTQALAARFQRVDGVDIAPSMLRRARELNRHSGSCQYHLNAREDLALFPDQAFTFVYSMLVLQHMRPRYAIRYLQEFLRLLAPGGALVFQVPAEAPAEATPSTLAEQGALPEDAFRARIDVSATALVLQSGEAVVLQARITNLSSHPWPSTPATNGLLHVQLANRWLYAEGAVHQREDVRVALPSDLQPGQGVDLLVHLVAPARHGAYLLELDLVQEGVTWFQERGSPAVRIPCSVEAGAERAPARVTALSARPPLFAGFRARRPRLHDLLRRLGVVPLYRAATVFTRRLRDRWRRWRRPRLVMEMHALRQAEVRHVIEAGGGRLLEIETDSWPGGILSARYWVVKPGGSPGSQA